MTIGEKGMQLEVMEVMAEGVKGIRFPGGLADLLTSLNVRLRYHRERGNKTGAANVMGIIVAQAKGRFKVNGEGYAVIGTGTGVASPQTGTLSVNASPPPRPLTPPRQSGVNGGVTGPRVCPCCGQPSPGKGYYLPGHDARVHSWLSKIQKGAMSEAEVPHRVALMLGLYVASRGKATMRELAEATE